MVPADRPSIYHFVPHAVSRVRARTLSNSGELELRVPAPLPWQSSAHDGIDRAHAPSLETRGFRNIALWTRGVDVTVFRPYPRELLDAPRPILLYAGRVAVEKNLEAFLELEVPGTKYVVGGGPALEALSKRYPAAVFTGYKYGEELARHLSAADVFVFPSRTDTFGIVLLEAMACGTPVAAFPVVGPIDVVKERISGCLHEDLQAAIAGALTLDREACRQYAQGFTWERATQQFLGNLQPRVSIPGATALAVRAE